MFLLICCYISYLFSLCLPVFISASCLIYSLTMISFVSLPEVAVQGLINRESWEIGSIINVGGGHCHAVYG